MAESEHAQRHALPAAMISRKKISVWSILKNCIGKDLSKITMPVVLNEPLSFLQRLCEYMEYAEILTQAAHQDNPADRMKCVAAFAVSALASNWDRLGKPFNPLLGETYELQKEDYRIICEQVSHHPPVSAFHAESTDFKFHGSINPKIKFSGKNVEVHPNGIVTVEFPKWNETYTWSNVNCCVHNIIVGKLWIEQHGTMEITNHSTGHTAKLIFKSSTSADKDLHRVEGFVKDENGQNLFFLYGKWTKFLKCCPYENYDEYRKHEMKIKDDKETTASPNATPKRMFSKLNSFKLNSFRSLSIQDHENYPPADIDGDFPRSDSSFSLDIPDSTLLWSCNPRPENSSEYYNFTNFAMQLNAMDNMKPPDTLCPTDARLRPDILCLENGDLDGASKEKTRLEEKQRDSRKLKKSEDGGDFTPRWFKKVYSPFTKSEVWLYSGSYWNRDYETTNSLF
ncbi:oxysterol-binding protein-related protein 2 isoform X1 [Drosophila sulfurigaster albostrigata]|uniref:Oxysterol-binding protein n=2 Tax=Drosophila albomicans TaxID=7291 RepID=A0A6P8X028_DROAB|nr:oxysterol-binding protein-related protein 2 isoform X1 [Drosophila albomicans]XP_034109426.1 oxysterol-binding protein-related protein 2 isoform X1 [Drosophila albomicans]XP_051861692.1 oxysterol-binding protein-related protein 2 isoform X1 [Drosophila albomicans]XP_060659690.1 oxysterol-binding protein-related protein 2 isoform X1 [Drosophila nasuta]XP_060659691.1 oxysterol-binding protein-related protein 2 isoform X1 [Drosophila nasuta]XP_062130434.1 oxysterol-binding protein-related prot